MSNGASPNNNDLFGLSLANPTNRNEDHWPPFISVGFARNSPKNVCLWWVMRRLYQTATVAHIFCGHPILERGSAVLLLLLLLLLCHAQGTPPWILKRAGLESSGRRLISSILLLLLLLCHAQGTPPWILKRGGLESSGRIASS